MLRHNQLLEFSIDRPITNVFIDVYRCIYIYIHTCVKTLPTLSNFCYRQQEQAVTVLCKIFDKNICLGNYDLIRMYTVLLNMSCYFLGPEDIKEVSLCSTNGKSMQNARKLW